MAVPTVDREFAPIRSWSMMTDAVRLVSSSTSGRGREGMKPWMKALQVSSMRRRDSAATVLKTREDLPEPDRPVTTVSFRSGRSTSMFFRSLTRAPRTRIVSRGSGRDGTDDAGSDAVRGSAFTGSIMPDDWWWDHGHTDLTPGGIPFGTAAFRTVGWPC